MHECRIGSRTKKMSDAQHCVLDSLPLVSPLGFHFPSSQILSCSSTLVQSSYGRIFPLQSVHRTPESAVKGFRPFPGR